MGGIARTKRIRLALGGDTKPRLRQIGPSALRALGPSRLNRPAAGHTFRRLGSIVRFWSFGTDIDIHPPEEKAIARTATVGTDRHVLSNDEPRIVPPSRKKARFGLLASLGPSEIRPTAAEEFEARPHKPLPKLGAVTERTTESSALENEPRPFLTHVGAPRIGSNPTNTKHPRQDSNLRHRL